MISKYKIVTEEGEWNSILDTFDKKNLYFEYRYFDLYRSESETPLLVYMETDIGRMAYPFLIRDISYSEKFKDKIERSLYFDISTAYGYGGHLIEPAEEGLRCELIDLFYKNFTIFCKERNIISEFIRFSPLLKNHRGLDSVIETILLKKVVSTDLQLYGDPLDSEVKKRKIKDARKARERGLTTSFEFSPKSLDSQIKIYKDTMDRNEASDFYYFDDNYFDKLLKNLNDDLLLVNVILDEKIIGFELSFIYEKFIYAHIAGTISDYLKYSPNDLSTVDIIDWGHKAGYSQYLTGGGVTSDEDDSLYLYKKAFSKNSNLNFYIGKKIWDKKSYDYLCNLITVDDQNSYFPAYRG